MNEPYLFRDVESKGIVNSDEAGYNKYIETKQKIAAQREEINCLRRDICDLQQSIMQILSKLETNGKQ